MKNESVKVNFVPVTLFQRRTHKFRLSHDAELYETFESRTEKGKKTSKTHKMNTIKCCEIRF